MQEELRQLRADSLFARVVQRTRLSDKEAALAKQGEELQRLRGDPDTLRSISPALLLELTETLTGALSHVQREQRLRCESQADQFICVVCLVERRSVVLQPCGHVVLCFACSTRCGATCPQCRTAVKQRSRVYF